MATELTTKPCLLVLFRTNYWLLDIKHEVIFDTLVNSCLITHLADTEQHYYSFEIMFTGDLTNVCQIISLFLA